MRPKPALFWVLAAVTLSVYLTMVLWSLPRIADAAGGRAPFDLRPLGYGLFEARAFLAALTAEGKAFYLDVQAWLDTAFPILHAVTLALAFRWLLADARPAPRVAAIALALAAGAADLLENHRVAGLLRAGADGASDAMILAASHASVTKSVLTTVSYVVLVAVLAAAWRRRRG